MLEIDLRTALNGMFYLLKTGCQWNQLPRDFPHPQSIYYHYRKWCRDGTWERINSAQVIQDRQTEGRNDLPSADALDSQSVKTFVLVPRRWVVERTFTWLGHARRLSKNYEEWCECSERLIYLASIHRLLKHLMPKSQLA